MLSNMRLAVQTPNIHTPSPLRFYSAIKMHGKNKKSKWRFIRSSCFAVTRLTIQVRLNGRHQARYISSACDTILRNVKLLYRISSANVKSFGVRFPGFSVLFTTQNPLKPPYPQKTPQWRRCIPVFSFQGPCVGSAVHCKLPVHAKTSLHMPTAEISPMGEPMGDISHRKKSYEK